MKTAIGLAFVRINLNSQQLNEFTKQEPTTTPAPTAASSSSSSAPPTSPKSSSPLRSKALATNTETGPTASSTSTTSSKPKIELSSFLKKDSDDELKPGHLFFNKGIVLFFFSFHALPSFWKRKQQTPVFSNTYNEITAIVFNLRPKQQQKDIKSSQSSDDDTKQAIKPSNSNQHNNKKPGATSTATNTGKKSTNADAPLNKKHKPLDESHSDVGSSDDDKILEKRSSSRNKPSKPLVCAFFINCTNCKCLFVIYPTTWLRSLLCQSGVVFVLSGFVNPDRSNLRDMVTELGEWTIINSICFVLHIHISVFIPY